MARPQEVLRRLGDPTRLRVLTSLLAGRKNVSQIVTELGLSQPQVSYHLRMLREARLATEERDGRWIWYEANWSSADGHVRELLTLLAGWSGGRPRTQRKAAKAVPPRAAEDAAEESLPAGEDRPAVERPKRPNSDMDDFLL